MWAECILEEFLRVEQQNFLPPMFSLSSSRLQTGEKRSWSSYSLLNEMQGLSCGKVVEYEHSNVTSNFSWSWLPTDYTETKFLLPRNAFKIGKFWVFQWKTIEQILQPSLGAYLCIGCTKGRTLGFKPSARSKLLIKTLKSSLLIFNH